MELFHAHLLGVKDNLYKPGNVININPNTFNNRIYDRIYNANVSVSAKDFPITVEHINAVISQYGIVLNKSVNLGDLSSHFRKMTKAAFESGGELYVEPDEFIKFFNKVSVACLSAGTNYREMALEEYRKDNCPDKPSRLHSLFACSEAGIDHWKDNLFDGDLDVYRIEVENEPFVSNDILLPDEEVAYGIKVKQAHRYFYPKQKDLNDETNEYLVQGKVRILEKIDEVKR